MGKHRRGDDEPKSPFLVGAESTAPSHSLVEVDVCHNVIHNSYSVWREPVE